MENEKNKLGLTLDDYRCPICHTLHATTHAEVAFVAGNTINVSHAITM